MCLLTNAIVLTPSVVSEQIEQQSCQKGKLEPRPSKTSPFLKLDEFMALSQKKHIYVSGYFRWQMNYQ